MAQARTATIRIYAQKSSSFKTLTLSPEKFDSIFSTPLELVCLSSGSVVVVTSLEDAVLGSQDGSRRLCLPRSFIADLEDLQGFVANNTEAQEREATRALSGDPVLTGKYGPLQAVSGGEGVKVQLLSAAPAQSLAPDGLLTSCEGSVLIYHSVKHSPSVKHVQAVLADAKKLQLMLSDLEHVQTVPREAKAQLRSCSTVLPFLSGLNFRPELEELCRSLKVGAARPDGQGYVVVSAPEL